MPRGLLIVLLTLGTVGGFASGFASMRGHAMRRRAHFEKLEQRAVDACERGAIQALASRQAPAMPAVAMPARAVEAPQ